MIPFQGCVILFIGGLFPVVSDWFLEARFSYKCDLLQVNWKTFQENDPRGLILKIVPHLWSYEASLGKRSGTFAFKAFHALAAALEDDQVAKLPPCRMTGVRSRQRSARILDPGNSRRESASFFLARPREMIFLSLDLVSKHENNNM